MGKKKKKNYPAKQIKKVISTPTINEKAIKEDISKLEDKREKTPKGFKGFLQRAALNKQISEKRAYFGAKDKLRKMAQQKEIIKSQVEIEKAKVELKEVRDKSKVDFGDFGIGSTNKQIKVEDIFK